MLPAFLLPADGVGWSLNLSVHAFAVPLGNRQSPELQLPMKFRGNPSSLPCLFAAPASAKFFVDFNSTAQDGGPHPDAGHNSYHAAHENSGMTANANEWIWRKGLEIATFISGLLNLVIKMRSDSFSVPY